MVHKLKALKPINLIKTEPQTPVVGQLTLTWQHGDLQGSTVDFYTIEEWKKGDSDYTLVETFKPTDATITIDDIIGAKDYKFRVRSNDETTGQSDWSDDYLYTAPPGKPSQPRNFNKKEPLEDAD